VQAQTFTYVHTDALDSPVAKTNASKAIVSITRYEPYGMTSAGNAPTIGFTGHVNDADTGLTYMQQRYYDPLAGRLLSIDPVTTDANSGSSFNRYAYAANNPYKYIDPDGRQERAAEGFSAAMAKDPRSMEAFGPAAAVVTAVMAAPLAYELGMVALTNPVAVNSAVATLGEGAGVTGAAGAPAVAGKEAVAVAGKITGYTKHGLNQAISRDGGRGVSPTAILSAVKDPVKVTEQAGGKVAYTGKDAKVVLNGDGKVVTVVPKNSGALRDPNVK
jgi:RHS repeat-associated protein